MRGRIIRRARRFLRSRGDAGVTMMDVMVAMGITSIAVAIATTGMVQLYDVVHTTTRVDDVYRQIGFAYQRLDQEIRYAYDISAPGAAADGNPSVEYLTRESSGSWTCNQLRLIGDKLDVRRWPVTSAAPTGGWRVLASGLSGPTTPDPDPSPPAAVAAQVARFPDFLPATLSGSAAAGASGFAQLRIRLTATSAEPKGTTRRETSMTFVAGNSTLSQHDSRVCSTGRSTS